MLQSLKQAHRVLSGLAVAALVCGFGWSAAANASDDAATTPPPAAASSSVTVASTIAPIVPCAALNQSGGLPNANVPDFTKIPGAVTRITSATDVPATDKAPEYCDVQGYVQTAVHFELKLPVATYQGRYLQAGCGGFCGAITKTSFPSCDAQLGGDFAISSTDDGHQTPSSTDGVWAGSDLRTRTDFGSRAVHVVAVASKAIQQAYYGIAPKKSYFQGCSDGGREGLMEAQRYPHDFNGIIVGAPANYMSIDPQWLGYEVAANTDQKGDAILTPDKLAPLHEAVVAACDANDGVKGDGLIGDPRDCNFDPGSVRCTATSDPSACLTSAQVAVVRKIYHGAVDSHDDLLDPRQVPKGSELSWAGWWVPVPAPATSPAGTPPSFAAKSFGENVAGYLSYPIGRGKALADVRFTRSEWNTLIRTSSHVYDAIDPDLTAFEEAGGKLLIYQGEADTLNPGSSTLDYYNAVTKKMGGLEKTQRFARLFMVNGMGHCGGGPTPASGDLAQAMVNWVEAGQAPSAIMATDTNAITNETRTRPVYPYPLVAKYVGPDPTTEPTAADDPTNFVSAEPAVKHTDGIDWLGERMLLGHAH